MQFITPVRYLWAQVSHLDKLWGENPEQLTANSVNTTIQRATLCKIKLSNVGSLRKRSATGDGRNGVCTGVTFC